MQLQVENTLVFVDSIIMCAFLAIQNIPDLKSSIINTKHAENQLLLAVSLQLTLAVPPARMRSYAFLPYAPPKKTPK